MIDAVAPDSETFHSINDGNPTDLSVIISELNVGKYQKGADITVYLQTNSKPPSILCTIVQNHGTVEAIPKGEPHVYRITVIRK